MMTLNDFQTRANRTFKQDNSTKDKLVECSLGLMGEGGELIDHIKKHVFHGHELDTDYLNKELGDILYYVSTLATTLKINMDDVAWTNVDKLMKRYPNGFTEYDSKNRVEYEKD